MKILTKKEEARREEIIKNKMLLLAQRVYERTLRWCGNNDDAIPDKSHNLMAMADEILYSDNVIF